MSYRMVEQLSQTGHLAGFFSIWDFLLSFIDKIVTENCE